jgi:hypothetical protein
MINSYRFSCIMLVLFIGLFAIVGCRAAPPAATATFPVMTASPLSTTTPYVSAIPSPSLSPSPVPTITLTSTLAATSTITPTPLPSDTPTITPTLTPSYNAPGFYPINICTKKFILAWINYGLCVGNVQVQPDGLMVFSISQTFQGGVWIERINRPPDSENTDIYLVDNLGNRYDHKTVVGDAAKGGYYGSESPINGQFTFPPAVHGATAFTLRDDRYDAEVDGIVLEIIPIHWAELSLKWHSLGLNYNTDFWIPGQTTDGGGLLTHVNMPNCQVLEPKSTEIKGALKNASLVLGDTTYQLFGYTEAGKDFTVREYLAESGLPGLDAKNTVLLQVSIPLDNTMRCIMDANNVLANLLPLK